MTQRIRAFLLVEAAAFAAAAVVHFGVLVHGYEHRQARVAESVIALVLLAGLVVSWVRPRWTREAGIAAQGFALLGTLVGIFTIIVGVGPRTVPDVVYHLGIVAVLVWGLLVAVRAPANDARQAPGGRLVRVGLQIPSSTWPSGPARIGATLAEIARTAEACGFDWAERHLHEIDAACSAYDRRSALSSRSLDGPSDDAPGLHQ